MQTRLIKLLVIAALSLNASLAYGQTMQRHESQFPDNLVPQSHLITKKDEANIKSSAERVVKRFMDLLNFISTGLDLEVPELQKVIQDSYSLTSNKIFYDSLVLIEDDINHVELNAKVKEKNVVRYLYDFDLLYRKSNDVTVQFSNFKISNVKRKDYIYIKVFYDCLFNNNTVLSNASFTFKRRVAELKVEHINNKWKAWIINVHFPDSADTSLPDGNDVVIVDDTHPAQAEVANRDIDFQAMRQGDQDALYDHYLKEALFYESGKKYSEALKNYNMALSNKPDEAGRLSVKIHQLKTRISNIDLLNAKYKAGEYKDAIAGYGVAIKADPKCPDYYFGRGKCYIRVQDFKAALNDFNKAIESDSYNAEFYKARAALFEIQGEYANAIRDYSLYAGIDKENAYIYHKIAFLNSALGNLNEANDALDKAIAIKGDVAAFSNLKGELLYKLKKITDAEVSFSKAIGLDSANPAAYFHRGLCKLDLKKTAEAFRDFARAKVLNVGDLSYKRIQQICEDYYKAACIDYEAGNIDTAISKFDYAILVNPEDDQYRFKRGECWLKINEFGNAISNYTDVIKINPGHYDAYRQRGIARFNMSRFEEAIADFEMTLKLNLSQPQAFIHLGDTYIKLQNFAGAIKAYETGIVVSKSIKNAISQDLNAVLFNNLGQAYFYSGNPFKAIDAYNEAIKIKSKDGEVYFSRGNVFLSFNELDNAESDFKKALSFNEKHPLWNFKLGETYQKRGAYDLAIAQYNLVIALNPVKSLFLEILYNRGFCLTNMNRYDQALADYQKLLENKAEGRFKDLFLVLGSTCLKLNKPDSALGYLNNSQSPDSLKIFTNYQIALAFMQKKQTEDALTWLEKALNFPSGKLKQEMVYSDFSTLKEDARFKSLMKKYY
jgi:tetratricopeptide (TPR) repeat protein